MGSQRQYQGKNIEAIRDSLELLWRQHLQRQGRESPQPPQEFIDETGRKSWTDWQQLCERNESEADGDSPYASTIPPAG